MHHGTFSQWDNHEWSFEDMTARVGSQGDHYSKKETMGESGGDVEVFPKKCNIVLTLSLAMMMMMIMSPLMKESRLKVMLKWNNLEIFFEESQERNDKIRKKNS